jgi:tetratricopeptide (TPR) repeat protein
VLLINVNALRIDFAQIELLLAAFRSCASDQVSADVTVPILLIIDDAATQHRLWLKLVSYLQSRGHRTITVVAERNGDWNAICDDVDVGETFRTYTLSTDFDDDERDRIAQHLERLGYLRTRGSAAAQIIRDTLNDSLFATFYTFVNPSRIPLDRIIDEQYSELPPLQRDAFSILCLLYQFDLTCPFELLVRCLQTAFESFHREVVSGTAAKIIFEEEATPGHLAYRPHHRIIAERTVARFLPDAENQFSFYERMFRAANLSNPDDWRVIVRLVVDCIGPNARRHGPLSAEHVRRLLDVLIEKGAGRSVLHHRGLLEQREGNYESAEVFLRRALDDKQKYDENYRSESDQNIRTSLGTVYADWGIALRKQGNTAQSDRLLAEAARCFQDSRRGGFANGHAYHAHAIMLRNKGRVDRSPVSSLDDISEAIAILDEAKDTLDDELLLPIRELEAELLVEFGNPEIASVAARQLADDYGSTAGYSMWAASEMERVPPPSSAQFKAAVDKVIAICQEGLRINNAEYRVLRVLARCYGNLGMPELKARYETLLRLKAVYPRFLPSANYGLACSAFMLKKYREAKNHFDELADRLRADDLRFRGREYCLDETGAKRVFTGYINDVEAFEGRVTCSELAEPYSTLYFNPRFEAVSLSRGDHVRFVIHFNHRGPNAREIRRVS